MKRKRVSRDEKYIIKVMERIRFAGKENPAREAFGVPTPRAIELEIRLAIKYARESDLATVKRFIAKNEITYTEDLIDAIKRRGKE